MSNDFKDLWNSLKHYWNKLFGILEKIGVSKKAKNTWSWIKSEYKK